MKLIELDKELEKTLINTIITDRKSKPIDPEDDPYRDSILQVITNKFISSLFFWFKKMEILSQFLFSFSEIGQRINWILKWRERSILGGFLEFFLRFSKIPKKIEKSICSTKIIPKIQKKNDLKFWKRLKNDQNYLKSRFLTSSSLQKWDFPPKKIYGGLYVIQNSHPCAKRIF